MPLEIKAILAKADVPNKNGRVYSKAILERVVRDAQENLPRGQALVTTQPIGEQAGLADIAGVAMDFSIEENHLVATIRLTDSPIGKVMQALIGAGMVHPPFAVRGVGRVENGTVMDFTMESISLDIEQLAQSKRLREVLLKKMGLKHERKDPKLSS